MAASFVTMNTALISVQQAAEIMDRELSTYPRQLRDGLIATWFKSEDMMSETEFLAELEDYKRVLAVRAQRPQSHVGEWVVPAEAKGFIVLEVLAETATSDRRIIPDGHFMAPYGFGIDLEKLRGFYKEPFVFRFRISQSQEPRPDRQDIPNGDVTTETILNDFRHRGPIHQAVRRLVQSMRINEELS